MIEINMNDKEITNIVDEVFEEIEVDDIRSAHETENQPEESATESRLISSIWFLHNRELYIRGTNECSVKQSVDIRENVDAWPCRLRNKRL